MANYEKAAVVFKPATLTKFHRNLLSRNYHRLFSSRTNAKPGPKGPPNDLVRVFSEMKRRNARFGCPRIAQQTNKAFGLNIDKDVVRRVLAKHYRPEHYDGGPSWLTFFRQMAESLWSITLFQSRSILPIFLSNLINPFLMTGSFGEIRSSKINSETVPGHAESQNSDQKSYIREEQRALFAA